MDKRINDLKIDFTKVVDLKNENIRMFETLDLKIKNLKNIYAEFIKNNKHNLFIFGLDSFHFQGKIIDIEYDDMKRLYYAITNRIYCEYFKLYKIVVDYIIENIDDDKKLLDLVSVDNNFPIYKDLEPFKQYNFEIIQSVHETIISLLNGIYNYLLHKEHDLKQHQEKNATGLNIDNFIQTFNFNNLVIREKVVLFISYIEFFHKLHTKYFKRFTTKMQLFLSQINNDIKFEDSVEINRTKRKSMMETFASDNIDKNILLDLKKSIVDENTDNSSTETPLNSPNIRIEKNNVSSLNGIFLSIDDEVIDDEVIEDKNKLIEQQEEKEEEKEEDDNISLLTNSDLSEIKNEETNNKETKMNEKPKRKYKPRKKKDDK